MSPQDKVERVLKEIMWHFQKVKHTMDTRTK